jgi:hypothetical protein
MGCAGAAVEEPRLALGTGTWRFEPIEDGQSLPMIMGAQGGWHVWLSVRLEGLDMDRGSLTIELQPEDERDPPQITELGIELDPMDADGGRNYLGWPAILPDPACAAGQMFRVRAEIGTSAGDRFEDERYVMPIAGENPPPPCPE